MNARTAALPSGPRARSESTTPQRVAVLEERQRSNDERFVKLDDRLVQIEQNVRLLLDIVQRVTGAKALVIAIGSFAGITAGTVTATVALIRYVTGH